MQGLILSLFKTGTLTLDIRRVVQIELENVAFNDVLPLKVARRNDIANLKCFWGL